MAKSKNPNPDPILAAPFPAVKPATPKQVDAAGLKGNVVSRYSGAPESKKDVLAPAAILPADAKPKTDEEIAFDRFKKLELMEASEELTTMPIETWAKHHPEMVGKDFDPNDPIDVAQARFLQANSTDRQITADFEAREYTPLLFNPRTSGGHGRSSSPNSIIDDGFKAPAFKLSKAEARSALAADIRTVSEMYAAEAGMSAKDFAKVMGGIATIESSFGVKRSVTGTKYESSAGGAFHYLNGTIAGEVRQNLNDPRIASRVQQLGVSVGDGVSKSEAWTMKEDNVLAGSVLAKRIIEAVRANPKLKDDVDALTKRVYQAHNLGPAGALTLARGGVDALDDKSKANNPLFFSNNASDAEVDRRYTKFVANAIVSSSNFIEEAFAAPSATLAAAKPNDKRPTVVASVQLPERAPA